MQQVNKVSVFILHCETGSNIQPALEQMIEYLPVESRNRFNYFTSSARQLQSLAGEVLARWAVEQVSGLSMSDLKIAISTKGKPYLEEFSDVHFNISHSAGYIVCAVASSQVGIDVERNRKVNMAVAKKYFTKLENLQLDQLEEPEKSALFIRFWTIKESYLKAIGEGISNHLGSFSVEQTGDRFRLTGNTRAEQFEVQFLALQQDAALAVTATKPFIISEIRYLWLDDWLAKMAK